MTTLFIKTRYSILFAFSFLFFSVSSKAQQEQTISSSIQQTDVVLCYLSLVNQLQNKPNHQEREKLLQEFIALQEKCGQLQQKIETVNDATKFDEFCQRLEITTKLLKAFIHQSNGSY